MSDLCLSIQQGIYCQDFLLDIRFPEQSFFKVYPDRVNLTQRPYYYQTPPLAEPILIGTQAVSGATFEYILDKSQAMAQKM